MVTDVEVMCVDKTDRYNPHEKIRSIGGKHNGSSWQMSQEKAIEAIENQTIRFFVNKGGNRVNVVVARSQYGNKYIKTTADGEQPNNLLSLQACPV